jgi:L,D-transpeptidase ErfK/SrfK
MKNALPILLTGLLLAAMPAMAYDLSYVGDEKTIEAHYEDTLVYLARDYNLGFLELKSANPDIDPWIPGEGTEIFLPTRHLLPDAPKDGIVINLAEMRLYAFVEKDTPPQTFPLGVGREGLETPTGTTSIVRKVKGPVWYPTDRMREEDPELPEYIGPGAENPLGTHAMYLGWPEYLIHGTNRPFGIGRRVSSGCIRMYPEAIVKLYGEIPIGTKVTVVDQPIKYGWIGDQFFVEAHTTKEQSLELEDNGSVTASSLSEDEKKAIEKAAGEYADKLDWDKIDALVSSRSGIPAAVFTKPALDEKIYDDAIVSAALTEVTETATETTDIEPATDDNENKVEDITENQPEDMGYDVDKSAQTKDGEDSENMVPPPPIRMSENDKIKENLND